MERKPCVGDVWRHRNGNLYIVMCLANAHTERPEKYPITVVYLGCINGKVWARPLSDWHRSMTYVGRDPEPNEDADDSD